VTLVSELLDADDATEGSVCEGIPDEACTDAPRNFALNAANGAATKTAEQLASPGVVLPLLLAAVGAPVALAGALEPAYDVGGDSFDYALDEHTLHLAVFDAMGHGVEAASMATLLVGAYRHGRINRSTLRAMYLRMDEVMGASFPGRFATALIGCLDTRTGELRWINAGHPSGLLIRGGRVVDELSGPVTRPVGFGQAQPHVHSVGLRPGDRVLFFTDGVVEERLDGGDQFGERRLRRFIEDNALHRLPTAESVRLLSLALLSGRGGRTSDDATLLMVEWRGPPRDDELARGIPEGVPAGTVLA